MKMLIAGAGPAGLYLGYLVKRQLPGWQIRMVEQNARGALAIADHGVVLNLGRVVAAADAATLAADVALRHHYLGF